MDQQEVYNALVQLREQTEGLRRQQAHDGEQLARMFAALQQQGAQGAQQQQARAAPPQVPQQGGPQQRLLIREVRLPRLGAPTAAGVTPDISAAVLNSWMAQARLLTSDLAIEEAWPIWLAAMDGRYQGRLQTAGLRQRPESIVDADAMADYFTEQFLPREPELQRDRRIRQRVVYRRGMSAEEYVRMFQDEVAATPQRSDRPFNEETKRDLFLSGLQGVKETRNMLLLVRDAPDLQPEAGVQGLFRVMHEYESLYRDEAPERPLPAATTGMVPMDVNGVGARGGKTWQGRGRGTTGGSGIRCYNCGKNGHIARECSARLSDERQMQRGGRGGAGRGRGRGRQAYVRGISVDDDAGRYGDYDDDQVEPLYAVKTPGYCTRNEEVDVVLDEQPRKAGHRRMLWEGTIDGRYGLARVSVLVDSGATRNMVSRKVAEAMLATRTGGSTTFRFANGTCHVSDKYAPDVPLVIQDYRVVLSLLVCDLHNADIVLGMEWLTKENPHIDWSTGRITIQERHGIPESEEVPHAREETSAERNDTSTSPGGLGTPTARLQADETKTDSNSPGTNEPFETSAALRAVVAKHSEVFQAPQGLPPLRKGHDHRIVVKEDAQPPYKNPFRLAAVEMEELDRQLRELMAKGHIRPSSSPFGAPTLFAGKKDGSRRLCCDYRGLNEVTVRDRYPLPHIGAMLDRLQGARIFSKMDLKAGYHQVRVAEEDIHKTAFVTHAGSYEWLVMPMGLCNAPATFQRLMNSVLSRFASFCLPYLDDILVFSETEQEHTEHVRLILEALQEQGIRLHPGKCEFGRTEISFLGHTIIPGGVKMEADKTSAVRDWAVPQSKKQLQSFLGFCNFYRDFVNGYAHLTAPLTDMLRDSVAHAALPNPLPDTAMKAFLALKEAMCRAPVLRMVRPNLHFVLTTDASDVAVACVLAQRFDDGEAPVAYKSRKLNAAERNYSARDRELLALVYATKALRHYLLDQRFTVRTDHQSLQYWRTMNIEGGGSEKRWHRWTEQLRDFDFEVVYIKGASNSADGLTRNGAAREVDDSTSEDAECMAVAVAQVLIPGTAEEDLAEDPYFAPILSHVRTGDSVSATHQQRARPFRWENEALVKIDGDERRRCVAGEANQRQLIAEYHATLTGGHQGHRRTTALLAQDFFWPGLARMVKKAVATCTTCQRAKTPGTAKTPPQPIELPEAPGECVTIDFMELPMSRRGNDYLLVVVDKLTKLVRTAATTKTISAEGAAELLLAIVLPTHGRLPVTIISDRDPRFTAQLWGELWRRCGTTLRMTTAHRPQADGQTERANRQIQEYLRGVVNSNGTDWDSPATLALMEFALNAHVSSATGASPFELHMGRRAVVPAMLLRTGGEPEIPIEARWRAARDALHQAQERMVQYGGGSRPPDEVLPQYQPGDEVLLNTRNYPQFRRSKLDVPFYGPLRVRRVLSPRTLELVLPAEWGIHPVVNIAVVKRFQRDGQAAAPPPPIQDERGRDHYLVERITARRARRGRKECRVKWLGYEEETWEPEANVGKRFIEEYQDTLPRARVRRRGERGGEGG